MISFPIISRTLMPWCTKRSVCTLPSLILHAWQVRVTEKLIQCLIHWAQAAQDDVIPLSKPVRTRSGKLVDHISVAKGTYLSVSVPCMNRSMTLWGPDAKEFKPERWIMDGGIPAGAKEVQGYRHLLTFIDGPRTCLGKGFAIAEFKVWPAPPNRCRGWH